MSAPEPVRAREQLGAFSKRLDEAAGRWRGIARLRSGSGERAECVRLAARLSALANVARSRRYAHLFTVAMISDPYTMSTAKLADAVIQQLPGGKIPGYRE